MSTNINNFISDPRQDMLDSMKKDKDELTRHYDLSEVSLPLSKQRKKCESLQRKQKTIKRQKEEPKCNLNYVNRKCQVRALNPHPLFLGTGSGFDVRNFRLLVHFLVREKKADKDFFPFDMYRKLEMCVGS